MLLCLCVVASVGFVALITVFFRHATPRNHNIPDFNHWAIPTVGWLVVWGLTALSDNISVYIRPSPKEREKKEKG